MPLETVESQVFGLIGLGNGRRDGLFGGGDCECGKDFIMKEIFDSQTANTASSTLNLLAIKDLATETSAGFGKVAYKALENAKDTEILMLKGFGEIGKQICDSTTAILMSQKDDKISCLEHKLLASEIDRKFEGVHASFGTLALQVGTIGSTLNQFAPSVKI